MPNWRFLIADTASFFQLPSRIDHGAASSKPIPVDAQSALPRKCFFSHFAMTCSKNFLYRIQLAEWLKRGGCPVGLPGFHNSTSQAIFHWVGATPLFNATLKTVLSIPELARMVHTLFSIPSGPSAFLALVQTLSTAA